MVERAQTQQDTASHAGPLPADFIPGVAEAIPVPVVLLTPDTRIRHANRAFVDMLDIGDEHYLHKKFPSHWLMRPGDGSADLRELIHRTTQSGRDPDPMSLSLRSSNGRLIPTEVYARPLPNLNRGPDSFIVVTFKHVEPPTAFRPVDPLEQHTNRHAPQGESEHPEERFKLLFEYAPDAYYLADLNGNFVDGNRAAEKLVGHKREELIGKSFLKLGLLPAREIPRAAKGLLRNAAGKPTGPEEFTLRRTDGTYVPIEVHTYPIEIDGRVLVLGIARDISERRTAETKLRDSETRYHQLHESSRDGCVSADLDGRILESNTAYREMLGYTDEQLRQMTYKDFTPQKWHAAEAQIVREQVLARGYSDLYEKEYIRRDGTVFPVELRAYLKRDAEDRPTAMWAIVRDISERRRAQEELRQSDRRFKAMTDSAQDAIMMMDPQGRITFYNKAAQAIFGWNAAEALGQNLHELISPARYHEAHRKGFAHFRNTGKGPAVGKTIELTALRKDGTEFPIEISLAGVELDDQWHAIGIVRDITERKQAQEAVLKEKAFSDSVINSMPGVFYMFDEKGNYVGWNRNLEEITGYSGEEIRKIHPTQFFQDLDRQRIRRAIAQAFGEGRTVVEADLVSKDGSRTPYFFTGVKVERDGRPYLVGLGIDITERRKAQLAQDKLNADLQSSVRELERSNRELRDFAHIAAHDLKAPLRSIGTLAEWLDQDYGDQIGPDGRENLHLLRTRADRMQRLINGILRYSEIGQGDRRLEVLDAQAIAEEVIEQIAPPEHIEIAIETTLPSVWAERTRLTQVFLNLIGNAVKYMDKPRGQIRVGCRQDGDFWEFRVTDNGPGIEAKYFARIFQMFQTLTARDQDDSTGLGLALVSKIVELYGGKVWLQSQPGQGSTFFFTFPKHRPQACDEAPEATSIAVSHNSPRG